MVLVLTRLTASSWQQPPPAMGKDFKPKFTTDGSILTPHEYADVDAKTGEGIQQAGESIKIDVSGLVASRWFLCCCTPWIRVPVHSGASPYTSTGSHDSGQKDTTLATAGGTDLCLAVPG